MLDSLLDVIGFGRAGRAAAYLALVVAIGAVALVVTGDGARTLVWTVLGALALGAFWHRFVGWRER